MLLPRCQNISSFPSLANPPLCIQSSLHSSGAQILHRGPSCNSPWPPGFGQVTPALRQGALRQPCCAGGYCTSGLVYKMKKRACIFFVKCLTLKNNLMRRFTLPIVWLLGILCFSPSNNGLLPNGKWCLTCFPFFVLSNVGCQVSVQMSKR